MTSLSVNDLFAVFGGDAADEEWRRPASDSSVLRKRPDLEIRFADMVWDFNETDYHEGRSSSQTRIDWLDVAEHYPEWLISSKELCWHRLNTQLITHKTVNVYTVCREQMRFKRFLRWMDIKHPEANAPEKVEQRHVHEYRKWLEHHENDDQIEASGANTRSKATCDPQTVWVYMLPLHAMDLYREYLSRPLSFRPYDGQLSSSFLGKSGPKLDNETPPLPDAVIAVLLDSAQRYLKHCGPTLMTMSDEMRDCWASGKTEFPGWKFKAQPCPETGIQWLPEMTGRSHHYFRAEFGHLIAACAVIILYLSGMRPGEVVNLEPDCLDKPVDPATGLRDRYQITGIPLKKRIVGKDGKPVKVNWVAPEIVGEAISMLNKMFAPYRAFHTSNKLMLSKDGLRPARDPNKVLKRSSRAGFPASTSALSDLINKFYQRAQWQWSQMQEKDLTLIEAIDYHIMPGQFRRTLARHIARQPFGIIAGRLQYHHVSIAIFEGYAGSASETFGLDVEDERILAGIDILEEMRSDARQGWRAGSGAKRVLDEWETVRETKSAQGIVDTSDTGSVLDNSVRKLAEKVHVGSLAYCVFNVSSALCLSGSEQQEANSPAISMCSPDKCGNAVVAPCHIPKWQALKNEADRLAHLARSGPQKKSLTEASKRYGRVMARAEGN